MRLILAILLAAVQLSAFAQAFELHGKDTINRRDANDLKQGKWKVFNTDGKYKGYNEGQLVEEGEYLDNKKSGVWVKFYPNGNKKQELTFTNNVASGYAKIYYKSGQLQEEGIWQQNRWSGQYKYYYEDGNLKYDWNYNASGKREGEQKYFHENGTLQYLGQWKNGNEAGELVEYYEDGSVKVKRYFNEGKIDPDKTENLVQGKVFDENVKKHSGKPVIALASGPKGPSYGHLADGYNKTFNSDGSVSKEGIFKDKKLVDGKEFVYEGGKVVKTFIVKDGKRVGEENPK